jgi:transmembrane sensor
MQHQKFKELIEKYLDESAGVEDMRQLSALLEDPAYVSLLDDLMLEQVTANTFKYELDDAVRTRIDQGIYEKTLAASQTFPPESVVRPIHRVHFLKKWGWVAAAVLLIGAVVAIAVTSNRKSNSPGAAVAVTPADILPGTNKAVLTIDNKQINLSADKTGIKVGETIAYNDGEKLSDAGRQLMLTTPNGGQYQLVLPDGTKAWLNAASSISFPAVFNGENRQIKITGEVYLEVAKDKAHPFLVDVAGQGTIEVLGTIFNVNSYGDDGKIKTSLIEGSIRMTARAFNNKSIVIKPGQRAAIAVAASGPLSGNSSNIIVDNDPDLSQTIAWKNGLFSFSNADLHSVMRQLERWYDIKVRYEGTPLPITLEGEMFRNVKLSDVLEFLKESGLKFRMEGKTLIVL